MLASISLSLDLILLAVTALAVISVLLYLTLFWRASSISSTKLLTQKEKVIAITEMHRNVQLLIEVERRLDETDEREQQVARKMQHQIGQLCNIVSQRDLEQFEWTDYENVVSDTAQIVDIVVFRYMQTVLIREYKTELLEHACEKLINLAGRQFGIKINSHIGVAWSIMRLHPAQQAILMRLMFALCFHACAEGQKEVWMDIDGKNGTIGLHFWYEALNDCSSLSESVHELAGYLYPLYYLQKSDKVFRLQFRQLTPDQVTSVVV